MKTILSISLALLLTKGAFGASSFSLSRCAWDDYSTTSVECTGDPFPVTISENGATGLNVNWVDNTTGETSFAIERSDDGGVNYLPLTTVLPDATTYADLGLVSGGVYVYRVKAIDSALSGRESNWIIGSGAVASGGVGPDVQIDGYVDGASYNFGNHLQSSTNPTATFQVRNIGGSDLIISNPTTAAPFSITVNPPVLTLAPTEFTSFTIDLDTTSTGTPSESLAMTTNVPGAKSTYDLTLGGTITAGGGANSNMSFAPHASNVSGACDGGDSNGISIADIDNDGYLDLVKWEHSRTGHCAWINDGDGTFTNDATWTTQTDPHGTAGWSVHHWDFDGDGDFDTQGRTTEGFKGWIENKTLTAGGAIDFGTFHPTPWGSGEYMSWGDFDRDGDLDISTKLGIYTLVGEVLHTGVGLPIDSSGSPTGPTEWVHFDVDNDGDLDAIEFKAGSSMYLNDGDGTYTLATVDPDVSAYCNDVKPSTGESFGETMVIADFDKDGDTDLGCVTQRDDNFALLINDGTGQFTVYDDTTNGTAFSLGGTQDTIKSAHNAEDYNNDGYPDVVIGQQAGEGNYLINNGDYTFTHLRTPAAIGVSKVSCDFKGRQTMAVGDFDWDGLLDVAEQKCGSNGVVGIGIAPHRNTTVSAGNYIQIILDGSEMGTNTNAIGTRITAKKTGVVVSSKELLANGKQMTTWGYIHLGVGAETTVDLDIVWPDGHTETITGYATNSRNKITRDVSDGTAIVTAWAPGSGW